jgi:uncharacterized protein YndB with AHSA1/START domain
MARAPCALVGAERVTVTFAEHEGKTKLTPRHAALPASGSERDMCQRGWAESLDRLAGCLAKD